MELVKAEGELIGQYAHEIPALAWSTGPSSYQYHFGRRALFDALVLRSWATPGTLFSADATTLALEDGQLLGIAITMLGPEFKERSAALGPLWPEMIAAGEVAEDEIAEVIEHSKLASWLNPVIYSNTYYVHAIAVKPEARGKHVGVALMENAMAIGRELGCTEFQLDVLSDNPAVGFYQSLGLEVLVQSHAPKPAAAGVPTEYRMGKAL